MKHPIDLVMWPIAIFVALVSILASIGIVGALIDLVTR